jgi:tRNA uridine 5-carbamoylmethylation protein Kti12
MLTKSKNSIDSLIEKIEIDLNKRFVTLAKPLELGFLVKQEGEYRQYILEIEKLQGVATDRRVHLMVEHTEGEFEFQSDIV